MAPAANETEKRRWNDQYWTTLWPRREALTDNVTADLLTQLEAKPGERVLDIGSGGGKAALAVGSQVGPEGHVVGADLSEALVALARERAGQAGSANVQFVVLDAQEASIPGAPFSVAMSQFGVMFFDEPAVAFANIFRQVEWGGRLVFACWQSMDRNPWALGHTVGSYTPPPPTPAPGKSQPGPFALGDFQRTADLLVIAGWEEPHAEAFERIVTVDRHFTQFARADGLLEVPVAYFIVTARKRRGSG